jgi:hypothetical protein
MSFPGVMCFLNTLMLQMPFAMTRRGIQQDHLRPHRKDVFMTRSHLRVNYRSKTEGKQLNGGIVAIKKID